MKNLFTQTPNVPETSFPTQLGKTTAIAAASTVGMVAGLVVAGAVKGKLAARRERKNSSTETTEE